MVNKKIPDTVLRKLDGGLRRLLCMTDSEIRRNVDLDRKRLEKMILEPERRSGKLPGRMDQKKVAAEKSGRIAYRADLIPHPVFGAVHIGKIRPLRLRIRSIIHFTGNKKDLEKIGLVVGSQAQDIFTVTGTKTQLIKLASQPATLWINLPRLLLPTVENASAQSEIAAVHNPRPPVNPNGFQGDGVIVGIIDSPLEVTHHGFRDPAGANDSRVLYYWVQDPQAGAPGQDPVTYHAANPAGRPNFTAGLNYGRIYDRVAITTAINLAGGTYGTGPGQISRPPSTAEHGTHTTGIAAGNGLNNDWIIANAIHIGAAPETDIIHVCYRWSYANLQNGVFEDDLINALQFIFDAADFHNQPAVASISLGTNVGPHNGTTLFDQACDNFLNSHTNRAIVMAAGNDDNWNGFKKGIIAATATETLTLTPRNMDSVFGTDPATDRWLDIWYRGPELEFEVRCGTSTGWQTAGNEFHSNASSPPNLLSGHSVDVDRGTDLSNLLRMIRLYIVGAQTTDVCTINLRNPDTTTAVDYYAWTGAQGSWAALNVPTHNELTLCDTCCARSILTVGACQKLTTANPAAGEIVTIYSGAGPTLDGRIKPEIVAVGGSARDLISTNSGLGSNYVGNHGTSMATPLVAGAVALLFNEYVPLGHDLTHDTVKALLIQNANRLGLHLDPSQAGYVAAERNTVTVACV